MWGGVVAQENRTSVHLGIEETASVDVAPSVNTSGVSSGHNREEPHPQPVAPPLQRQPRVTQQAPQETIKKSGSLPPSRAFALYSPKVQTLWTEPSGCKR